MGVNFKGQSSGRSRATWSYGGFQDFKERLAKQANIDLGKMKGYGGLISWETVNDPIAILLNHCDCDGILVPEECKKLAPRLKYLVENWESVDYDKINVLYLVDALEQCSNLNENLIFC